MAGSSLIFSWLGPDTKVESKLKNNNRAITRPLGTKPKKNTLYPSSFINEGNKVDLF